MSTTIFAQGDIEDMLYIEVDNLNPVYKPVVGFGAGLFNYFGEVRDVNQNPMNGPLGYKVNLATFVDNNHYIRGNFYFISGSISGNERSYKNLNENLNFKSNVFIFGINLNYDFDNLYKTYRRMHPFVSVGFETITFNSKIDSLAMVNGEPIPYHYWSDGTIRVRSQSESGADMSVRQVKRDYTYETDLRDTDWGMGAYPQYTFAVPVEAGLDYQITDRIMFRIAASYHFTFTDLIDHVSSENTSGRIGNKGNDNFLYTYATIHLDLFSSRKTLAIQKLMADIEWDNTLMGDEDGDNAFDGWDKCPNTPFGVEVDSLGCPFDDDNDGIPNYLDKEPLSLAGSYINDDGVAISEEELIAMLDMSNAVARKDVPLYLRTPESYANYRSVAAKEIPPKFVSVDGDGDGYISFDEMLNEMNRFFDFESNMSADDIRELNDFFFSQ